MKNAYIWNDTLMRGALKEMNFHIVNLSGSSFFNVKEEKMQLAIYGAGRLGKELYDLSIRINAIDHRWQHIFFIDDIRHEGQFYMKNKIEAVVANGTPRNRKKMAEVLS